MRRRVGASWRCAGWRSRRCLAVRVPLRTLHVSVGPALVLPQTVAAIQCQHRHQSTSDKKFHCSICFKAFRLEMAAKVHLRQSHNGEGTIEAGPGPAPNGGSNTGAGEGGVPPSPNAPPSAPVGPITSLYDERRPLRRARPIPKPLHVPDQAIPAEALAAVLDVWDSVGLARLGTAFIHSSMVPRISAAKNGEGEDAGYEAMAPEGENPFAAMDEGGATTAEESGTTTSGSPSTILRIALEEAFSFAEPVASGPWRAAQALNPLLRQRRSAGAKPAAAATPATSRLAAAPRREDPITAPVTPFGQLPVFGQERPVPSPTPAAPPSAQPANPIAASSPFASLASSPFAGAVASPFASSPFASAATAEATTTCEGTEPLLSPFAAATAASPFAEPSPFLPAGVAAPSPFPHATGAGEGVPSTPSGGWSEAMGASAAAMDATPAAPPPPPLHPCADCSRSFSSYDGLRMHCKAKHDMDLPKLSKTERHKVIPDLPVYVPSPVDLSLTAPFGSQREAQGWSEVELTPHAQCMSNMTVIGVVVHMERINDDVQITVFVGGERNEEGETLTLQCSAEMADACGCACNDRVFACGTLRLHEVQDHSLKAACQTPIIHISPSMGIIAKV